MRSGSERGTVFFTCVGSAGHVDRTVLLLDSIREFGGELGECPFWVLDAGAGAGSSTALAALGATVVPLTVPSSLGDYLFARKVSACAKAEELASGSVDTLIWLIPECLVVRPPSLLELSPPLSVAVRPVHISNVGLPAGEPADQPPPREVTHFCLPVLAFRAYMLSSSPAM